MSDERRLWGIGTPRTLRAHWMLHELGLEYELPPKALAALGRPIPGQ